MRDNSNPDPAETSAASLFQTIPSLLTPNRRDSGAEYPPWYSLPPSTTDFQYADKSWFSRFKPPQLKPLFQGFEGPSFSHIVVLTVLCLITYPLFDILTFVTKDRSLFVVRLIVSLWSSVAGFAFGCILLAIATQHLEAATWATVIHMSQEGGGMKLRDLARGSRNPTTLLPALHIFWSRFRNRGTAKDWHKSHDKRPRSPFLGFFVVLVILVLPLPFLFGRIMEIKTFIRNQSKAYHEVLIAGDLTVEDVTKFSVHLDKVMSDWVPSGRGSHETTKFVYDNDTVYFAQPSLSRSVPGGSASGTLDQTDTSNNSLLLTGRSAPERNTGAVFRHPQWGIRIHCEKLPNPEVNLLPNLPNRTYTYAVLPRDFLQGLFKVYGMDLPTRLTEPNIDDTIPSNIDPSTISYIVKMAGGKYPAVFDSTVVFDPDDDQGWAAIETVLIRLDTESVSAGRFPVCVNVTIPNGLSVIGYDAAVCVQRCDSWIVETYNTSIASPSILRIVGKWDGITPLFPSGNIQGTPIENTRYLNATGKSPRFDNANLGAIARMQRSINWYETFAPNEAVVSLTGGNGSYGYTELSPDRFAISRAQFGAAHALPYLVGSGHVVAQVYEDETLAYVTYKQWQLISLPILIWILGIVGELFVPTLPLNVPRREFGVYSWLALFQFQELQFEAADDPVKLKSLEELEEIFSGKRVKFVVEEDEV